MQLTTTYLDIWSTLSSTITSNINYKDTLFCRSNFTPIHGEPTFKTLHKLWKNIKANFKSVISNLGGGAHGHLGLVLTDAQYTLISPTPFVYPTHPGPISVPYGTTAHANSNMWIAHTKRVILFIEVMGVGQPLMQQVFFTVKEAYLAYISKRTTNSVIDTVTDILTHLQYNYGQLMPHELLERKDIVKKTIYNTR